MLKGLLSSALPLPARLALTVGPPALKAYGDWRAMNGHAKASTKHRSRQLASLVSAPSRRGFPWGVGLGGVALGAVSAGAAAFARRARGAKPAQHDAPAGRAQPHPSDAQTSVIRPGVGADAPTTPGARTTVEQKHGRH